MLIVEGGECLLASFGVQSSAGVAGAGAASDAVMGTMLGFMFRSASDLLACKQILILFRFVILTVKMVMTIQY